jgi:acetyl esterase/lipase
MLSYQPFKLLFQLAYVGSVVIRLPKWIIVAAVQRLRPHPKWTAKQTLMSYMTYALVDMQSRVGISDRISLKPGKEGSRFQVIKFSEEDVYQGPLASNIKPATVGGTWFPAAPGAEAASKIVILYFHGGAYVIGDGREAQCRFLGKAILQNAKVDALFSLQYRLSGYSGLNPFPAALQDALTGYLFLLRELKIPSHQIILAGDSAGGNLAIALLRYLQEFGSKLDISLPRCAALISPWVAPLDYDAVCKHPNHISDFLPAVFLQWGANVYAAGHSDPASNAYITPLGHPFSTSVPIFISSGSAEIFYDDNVRWAEEMRKVDGNVVRMNTEDAACHDTLLVAEILGFEKSAEEVASAMGTFINETL